ncbi:MAG: hypothetical protein R3Y49_06860 [Rikenellaceae bacterium]
MLKYSAIILVVLMSACTVFMPSGSASAILRGVESYSDASGRSVILVPMVHYGKAHHYQKVGEYLAQKSSEGYAIFYEGVSFASREDMEHLDEIMGDSTLLNEYRKRCDTLYRKYRRVVGFFNSGGENQYSDTANLSLPRKYRRGDKVTQSNSLLGLDTLPKVYWVDMTYPEIVARYESELQTITLTQYDWQTPLRAQYNPNDGVEYDRYKFLVEYRDEYIAQKALECDFNDVAIVYGREHLRGIAEALCEAGFSSR